MVLLSSILARSQQNIPANHARAFQLAQEAYDMGMGAAGENLGWYYRDGIGTTVDFVKSFRYLFEARDKGLANASARR